MERASRDYRHWIGFAKKLASRYVRAGIEACDLEQEALLTVLEELPKYTEDLGVSLKVFLGRKVRARLSSLYRKTLNLWQIEQFWEVRHVSGDSDSNVAVATRELAEAVIRANPDQYASAKFVKVLVTVGPSLDEDAGGNNEGHTDCMTLHEIVGESAEQDWMLPLKNRVMRVSVDADIAPLITMRGEGFTFEEIAQKLGRNTEAVKKAYYRSLKGKRAA